MIQSFLEKILASDLRAELFLSKALAIACKGSASLDSASAHKLKIGMYSLYTSRRSVMRKKIMTESKFSLMYVYHIMYHKQAEKYLLKDVFS